MKRKKSIGVYRRPKKSKRISYSLERGKERDSESAVLDEMAPDMTFRAQKQWGGKDSISTPSVGHREMNFCGFGTPMVKTSSNGEEGWEPIQVKRPSSQPRQNVWDRPHRTEQFAGMGDQEQGAHFSKNKNTGKTLDEDQEEYGKPIGHIRRKRHPRHAKLHFHFSVSPGFILLMAGLLYFDRQGIFLWLAPVCAVHELAHWVTLHFLGGGIAGIRLTVSGAALEWREEKTLSYPRELAATIAGPLANLVLAFAAAFIGKQFDMQILFLVSGLSLGFMAFNLLPAEPLDGGRSIYLMLAWLSTPTFAAYVIRALSILTATAVTVGGCYVIFHGGGFTLLTTGIWLMWKTFTPRKGLVKLALSV